MSYIQTSNTHRGPNNEHDIKTSTSTVDAKFPCGCWKFNIMNFNGKFSIWFSVPVRRVMVVLCCVPPIGFRYLQGNAHLIFVFITMPKVDLFHNEILFTMYDLYMGQTSWTFTNIVMWGLKDTLWPLLTEFYVRACECFLCVFLWLFYGVIC